MVPVSKKRDSFLYRKLLQYLFFDDFHIRNLRESLWQRNFDWLLWPLWLLARSRECMRSEIFSDMWQKRVIFFVSNCQALQKRDDSRKINWRNVSARRKEREKILLFPFPRWKRFSFVVGSTNNEPTNSSLDGCLKMNEMTL